MGPSDFVHLHVHSDFSLLDGAAKLEDLVKKAKSCNQTALALTDHGTLSGVVSFYKECKKAEIKPLLGTEAYLALGEGPDAHKERTKGYNHLTLIAKNDAGWKNLSRLASIANIEGYYYRPRMSLDLLRKHREGLIALSGCLKGPVAVPLVEQREAEARRAAEQYKEIFGEDFYLEIQPNSLDEQKVVNEGCLRLSKELSIKPVATCDLHYVEPEDAEAQEIRICIASGKTLKDESRLQMKSDFFFRSSESMQKSFSHVPQAILSTREIAEKVGSIDLLPGTKNIYYLPKFQTPDGTPANVFYRKLAHDGLKRRYGGTPSDQLLARLEFELGVMEKMGFVDYFLIVQDFINWSKQNGCPVGPGRGSAAGSLVAYCIGITDIDPIKYDLLFERFLNPDRVSMPDIDVDFCETNRWKAIDYVRRKYGEKNVCQIITFGTLKAKAVIRDVGRVLDIPLPEINSIAKLVPEGPKVTLESALEETPDLKKLRDEPQYRRLFDLALKLEGINRHAGKHAAGVVISDRDLLERIPLTNVGSGEEQALTTQFTMTEVEEAGLLKMDFLGLRTLTLITDCVNLIKKKGVALDEDRIPIDDRKTFELLARGDTRGVFQLESSGFRELLVRAKPDRFEDIIALLALYRPGPLGSHMDVTFVNRKHGKEPIVYDHPLLEPILNETYGCFLYQEQVMRVANKVAGFSLAQADTLRKAMGKKKVDLMEKYKSQFVGGCVKNTVPEAVATNLWDTIVKFAEYGFNKCVVGETVLIHARTGERTTVRDLFESQRPFDVHALGEDGKLRPRAVTAVVSNGRKPVFELRTAQGKTIRATGNHPFRTLDGWRNLEELRVGDRIATPRSLEVSTPATWPRHELVTLAGLLSEGNVCHPSCLYFFNRDRAFLEDFAGAAASFPETVARIDEHPSRPGAFQVCVSTGRDTRFEAGQKPWNASRPEGGVAVASAKATVRSGAFRWAERLGLLGLKATEKKVPAGVFALRDEDVALFLGRLWTGDGFFANATLAVPFYATSSRQLAVDVQTLLLRLGIVSGIHEKVFRYRGSERPGFTVHVLGDGAAEAFLRRVAPHAVGRDAQIAQLRSHVEGTLRGRTSKDTVPAEVRRWVDEERRRLGLTWSGLEELSGVSMKEFLGKGSRGKRGFRRSTLGRLAQALGSVRLARLADSDVFWDRIASIEPRGAEETFDLTVDVDHNFVADGVVVHNSHSAAYGLVTYKTAYLKANFPAEFMAATLTSWSGDTEKMVEYVDECKRMGLVLHAPDVNEGIATFDVRYVKAATPRKATGKAAAPGKSAPAPVAGKADKAHKSEKATGSSIVVDGPDGRPEIVYGLEAIRGAGSAAIQHLVEARGRAGGRFRSIFHFCEEVDPHVVNRATLEALVKAGAFGSTGARRSQLAAVVEQAIQMGTQAQKDKLSKQTSLFGGGGAEEEKKLDAKLLPEIAEWKDADLLAKEKEALGFYLSSHPLEPHRETIERFSSARTCDLAETVPGPVTIGGIVQGLRSKPDKRGNLMAFVTLEDFTGTVDGVVFGSVYAEVREHLKVDAPVFLQGKLDKSREQPSILVDAVIPAAEAEGRLRVCITADLIVEDTTDAQLHKLRDLFAARKGEDAVFYTFKRRSDGATTNLFKVGAHMKVQGNDALRREMLDLLGPTASVRIGAQAVATNPRG